MGKSTIAILVTSVPDNTINYVFNTHKNTPSENFLCKWSRVEETKVHEMALDYLDNTLSKSEKDHVLYYRALKKKSNS